MTVTKRPNFLIIVADDLGFSDIKPYGSEIETPVLDRLSKDGIGLTNFHTAQACSPTRSMLFSGTDNHIAGLGQMAEAAHMKRRVTGKDPSYVGKPGYEGYLNWKVAALPEILSDAGYLTIMFKAELKKHPELTLQRRQLGYLLAARTHHGDLADYHERFKHEDAELNCPCGRRKSPTHLFYCRKIPRSLRPRLAPEPEAAIRRYLGRSFQTYVKLADFYYAKINKRY